MNAQIFLCSNVLVENSLFTNAFGLTGNIIAGANLPNNRNALYTRCQFNDSVGGDDGVDENGMPAELGAGLVDGVHASDNPGQQITGSNIVFRECQFNSSRRIGTNPAPGLAQVTGTTIITNSNLSFIDCTAESIQTTNENCRALGWQVFSSAVDPVPPFGEVNNITFRGCAVSLVNLL